MINRNSKTNRLERKMTILYSSGRRERVDAFSWHNWFVHRFPEQEMPDYIDDDYVRGWRVSYDGISVASVGDLTFEDACEIAKLCDERAPVLEYRLFVHVDGTQGVRFTCGDDVRGIVESVFAEVLGR